MINDSMWETYMQKVASAHARGDDAALRALWSHKFAVLVPQTWGWNAAPAAAENHGILQPKQGKTA